MAYRRAQRNEQETLHLPAVSCLLTNVPSLTTNITSYWLSIALKRKVICDMSREQIKCLCKHLYVATCCSEYVVIQGYTMYCMHTCKCEVGECVFSLVWLMAQKEVSKLYFFSF